MRRQVVAKTGEGHHVDAMDVVVKPQAVKGRQMKKLLFLFLK
jgi:hypothetical protein